MSTSRWWHLDLMAAYPQLEIYPAGWKADQELGLLELGGRVMEHEGDWLPTWFYSTERDRIWAAVGEMFRMVLQAIRDRNLESVVGLVPAGWYPDVEARERGDL